MSLVDDIKKDPAGAGMAIVVPAFVVFTVAAFLSVYHTSQPDISSEIPLKRTYSVAEDPPEEWREKAKENDVMSAPGLNIAYWGKPGVSNYGPTLESETYTGIIVHYTLPARRSLTDQEWTVRLIKYQHNGDLSRGGHFGYHFYIDGEGGIYQGAPMTYRTNHVKPSRSRHRKPLGRELNNKNSIGISMIGGCVAVGQGLGTSCVKEEITPEQKQAGIALIAALKERYSLGCLVYGHGEVQGDRAVFEGSTMAQHIRETCE